MKKLLAILMTTAMVLTLASCGGNSKPAASSAASGGPATDPIKVKIAHTGTETCLSHQAIQVIADYMERESDGAFKVEIYANGQLGDDATLVTSAQAGDIQMSFTNTGNLISFVPELGVYATPFIFDSNETAYKVLDGEFGRNILDMMEGKTGLTGLGYLESVAFRELSANREIHTPDDLKGLKIRVMTNNIHIAIWETLGAQPTPITFSELYTALQQGTVDAQENPVELFITSRFNEVQDHLILTNHVFTTGMFFANSDWFNSLTPELQQICRDATNAGVEFQRKAASEQWDSWMETLEQEGVSVIELTPDELAQWQEKVAPVYDMIAKEAGAEVVADLQAAVASAK